MTFEEYRSGLKRLLKEADWRNPRDPEGPAAQLLKQAAADGMERMRKCACDALKTDDIVVEDVQDAKQLQTQRQSYHAQEVEFAKRAVMAAAGRKTCAKVLNVFDEAAMARKLDAVRAAAVGQAFRRCGSK